MQQTSYLKKASKMKAVTLPECHGGIGAVEWTEVLSRPAVEGRRLNFFHDDTLKPGVSIGVHRHSKDEEYYYILSGHGVMILDGEEHEVGPGDIAAVFPGGTHGLRNNTQEEMRILVFSVS